MTSVPHSRDFPLSDRTSGARSVPSQSQLGGGGVAAGSGAFGGGPGGIQQPPPVSVATGPGDSPDLSHLTLEERRIIEEVLQRQKHEEQIDAQVLQKCNAAPVQSQRPPQTGTKSNPPVNGAPEGAINFNTTNALPFGTTVAGMVSGAVHAVGGHSGAAHGIMDAVCGICEKTKFADGLGHVCAHCRRKTCTRCGYQLNTNVDQVQWTCKPCAQRAEHSDQTQMENHSAPTGNGRPNRPMSSAPGTTASETSSNPLDPKSAGRLLSGFLGMLSGNPQQQHQQPQQQRPPAMGDGNRFGAETRRLLPRVGPEVKSPAILRHSMVKGPVHPHSSGRELPKSSVLNRSTSLDPEQNSTAFPGDSRSSRGYLSRQYTDSEQTADRGPNLPPEWHEGELPHHGYSSYEDHRAENYPGDRFTDSQLHGQVRDPHARHLYSSSSRLDPNYGTECFTSDQSESPGGHSGSVSGWSAAGGAPAHTSSLAARYSGPSDTEYLQESYPLSPSRYLTPKRSHFYRPGKSVDPLDRVRAPHQFRTAPCEPIDLPVVREAAYRSFSSSEGEEFGMFGGEEAIMYPFGMNTSAPNSVRPRRALPRRQPDLTNTPNRPPTLDDDLSDIPRLSYASVRSTGNTYSRSDIVYGPRKTYASSSIDMPASPRSGRLPVDYQSAGRQRGENPFGRTSSETNSLLSLPGQAPITHPVTWNPSRDGKRLIGHMILRRQTDRGPSDVGSLLGLKIRGGKPNRSGRLCAYITRVKPGSPADVVGQLRAGDEVLEWNGLSLRDCTADDVSQIVHQSKADAQVELIVQRDLDSPFEYFVDEFRSQSSSPSDAFNLPAQQNSTQSLPDRWECDESRQRPSVQLSLWFDIDKSQLVVHLMRARDLIPTYQSTDSASSLCNSYCRIRLLPGRDDSTLKYSKLIARTNHPRWNQQFLFSDYTEDEIGQHDLELTVWNCALNSNEQTLMGEIIIDLSVADMSGTTYWYPLQMSDYSSGAPTPVIGSITGYHNQIPPDQSRGLLIPDNEGVVLSGSSTEGRNKSDYLETGIARSGDYSDIDDKTYCATAGQYASLHTLSSSGGLLHHRGRGQRVPSRLTRPDFGPEEMLAHSDISELSGASERSRVSLHTPQSERGKFHGPTPRISPRRHYSHSQYTGGGDPGSGVGGITAGAPGGPVTRVPVDLHQQISPESSSKSDRPQEPDDTSDDISLRQRRLTTCHRDEGRPAKESSSSECGSGMVSTGGIGDIMYGKLTAITTRSKEHHGLAQTSSGSNSRDGRKPRPSIGHKFSTVLGRSHKSSSTSNLDKKTRTSFQRSEEVLPQTETQYDELSAGENARGRLQTQLSLRSGKMDAQSSGEGADYDSRGSPILMRNESHVGEFVEGLGPGQLVGRQVLGMPCLGEIQLSFFDRKGHLEVEVIRARGLQHKNATKPLPAPYVKLHLLEGKQSVEKLRTTTPPRRTLDPLYQQQLTFSVPYHGKIIQISIWGEYGRMEKKVFLGMCEVVLDDLDLRSVVFGWYKLFGMIASNAHHHHHHHHRPPNVTQSELDNKCSADDATSLSSSKGLEEKACSPRLAGGPGSKTRTRSSISGDRSRSKSISEKLTSGRKSATKDQQKSKASQDNTQKTGHRHGR
ncbi:HMG-CoA synthase [Fasciola gigantica]|uniref:HMG-CoA synthase n=1 Tax=Fasciola gigantica TaxID=46835 RepID=A0A504YRN2_FASGI|nr:HMG-CoA synthase [Fasciola gigantica]